MALPKDIQELIDTLQLAGWSKIDEDDLIYEIFYGQDYPEHDTGDYDKWNEVFDTICEDLDVEHEVIGSGADNWSNVEYGVVRTKEFYYKAVWKVSYNGLPDISDIKSRITEVNPVQKMITVYEEV